LKRFVDSQKYSGFLDLYNYARKRNFPHPLKEYQEEFENPFIPRVISIIEEIEGFLSEIEISEMEGEDVNYENIQRFIKDYRYLALDLIRDSIDFRLELRHPERIITEDRFPNIWIACVRIPGDSSHQLDKDYGVRGYHIHYVETGGKKRGRSDIVFTYDPKEQKRKVRSDPLWWFKHSGAYSLKKDPALFCHKRKVAIYDCSYQILKKVGKNNFMPPLKSAKVLYP